MNMNDLLDPEVEALMQSNIKNARQLVEKWRKDKPVKKMQTGDELSPISQDDYIAGKIQETINASHQYALNRKRPYPVVHHSHFNYLIQEAIDKYGYDPAAKKRLLQLQQNPDTVTDDEITLYKLFKANCIATATDNYHKVTNEKVPISFRNWEFSDPNHKRGYVKTGFDKVYDANNPQKYQNYNPQNGDIYQPNKEHAVTLNEDGTSNYAPGDHTYNPYVTKSNNYQFNKKQGIVYRYVGTPEYREELGQEYRNKYPNTVKPVKPIEYKTPEYSPALKFKLKI